MNISDLVVIGRLGRLEPDGFYCVQLSQPYKSILNRLSECFLIFSSHRVFFVTVVEVKTTGQRSYLRFLEDGIAEECTRTKKVLVALAPEDLPEAKSDDTVKGLFGYKVWYQDEIIGTISDAMVNQLQSVFIIELVTGEELLVPNVEQYILAIDHDANIIRMQNLELLLELCKSTS